MAGLEFLTLLGAPQIAYLYPELDVNSRAQTIDAITARGRTYGDNAFIFQYWPSQVQDSYEVEYATKMIPGGSHPLYQWVGGSGRSVSFEAVFTAEVEVEGISLRATPTSLIPSSRYTVNVAGAISRLKSYQLPKYGPNGVKPPPKLRLVFPNSKAGGDVDDILCFLKSARVTRESCFPSGVIRVATVALEFIETVQHGSNSGQGSGPSVKFIDRGSFLPKTSNDAYEFTGNGGLIP